jgi:hypothetical protein
MADGGRWLVASPARTFAALHQRKSSSLCSRDIRSISCPDLRGFAPLRDAPSHKRIPAFPHSRIPAFPHNRLFAFSHKHTPAQTQILPTSKPPSPLTLSSPHFRISASSYKGTTFQHTITFPHKRILSFPENLPGNKTPSSVGYSHSRISALPHHRTIAKHYHNNASSHHRIPTFSHSHNTHRSIAQTHSHETAPPRHHRTIALPHKRNTQYSRHTTASSPHSTIASPHRCKNHSTSLHLRIPTFSHSHKTPSHLRISA